VREGVASVAFGEEAALRGLRLRSRLARNLRRPVGTAKACEEGGSHRVVVSLGRTALWPPELGILDRDYATKTAGSVDEHLYPDPDTFVVDTPMGPYRGVKEMIEMSKTPGEYKYPLTPLGWWQPGWL
jgi:hypothetical protein